MTFSSFDGRPRIDSSLSKLAIWRVAARRHRLIAGNSTRGVPRARPTTPPKGETSRNINSACLPLRACRPSGGFVLGTLAARLAPRQTAEIEGNPPVVEKHVHEMWPDMMTLWNGRVNDRSRGTNGCGNS